MNTDTGAGWSFADAREPAVFAACVLDTDPDLEHAAADEDGTLCRAPGYAARYRHHFGMRIGARFCPRCRELAAAASARPGVQERLHQRVLDVADGPLRTDLLAALRRGAPVPTWLNGPADFLVLHAGLDTLTEGTADAAAAFESTPTLSLALAEDGPWRYLVLLPHDHTPPLLARGPHTP
ncbi:hypothetical protein AB0F92_41890 [Kitasatospora aureofaciens]|uniref:hypothetical protein n=1 Tax=Kitasatospora aureofaciens TaxID=1894 RepID=UPI0033DB32E6